MIKIFCLLAALLVSVACKMDRPAKALEGYKFEVGYVNNVNLPAGQRFLYIIPKNQAKELGYGDGSENLFVTRGQSSSGITIWKSGRSPHSWEAVLSIKEN